MTTVFLGKIPEQLKFRELLLSIVQRFTLLVSALIKNLDLVISSVAYFWIKDI